MLSSVRRGAALLGLTTLVLAAGGCSSDPVADEPDLTGVATVRVLREPPAAGVDAPEVSGPRTVRFRYEVLSCEEEGSSILPAAVAATYTVDTVAVVLTPAPPGCGATEDPAQLTRGVELFLDQPVDDRTVTARLGSP